MSVELSEWLLRCFYLPPYIWEEGAICLSFILSWLIISRQKKAASKHLPAQTGATPQPTPPTNSTDGSKISEPALERSDSISNRALVSSGLSKTRGNILKRFKEIWTRPNKEIAAFWEELEEAMLQTDLGVQTTKFLLTKLREEFAESTTMPAWEDCESRLVKFVREIFGTDSLPLENQTRRAKDEGLAPYVVLVVGVNGSGKTTTIGKLAWQLSQSGFSVMLAACDTFRAAAGSQLEEWGKRANVMYEGGSDGDKPSTVAYKALARAKAEKVDVLIIDTAGRLHTRVNLMNELEGVIKVISREVPGSPHETLLVLDGSTGQNALTQARDFKQKAGVTGIVITKLDGTPRGGILVAIAGELALPVRYVGLGERKEDLKPFSADDFARALFEELA